MNLGPAVETTPTPDRSRVELLTEAEAAAIAKVSKKTIRRLIVAGRLPAVDYGSGRHHNYRINPEDLLRVQSPPTTDVPAASEIVPRQRRHTRGRTLTEYLPAWAQPAQVAKKNGKAEPRK